MLDNRLTRRTIIEYGLRVGVGLTAAPALAACGSSGTATKSTGGGSKPSLSSITVLTASPPGPTFVPEFAAAAAMKADHGVTVDLKQVNGANIVIEGLLSGEGQIGGSSLPAGIQLVAKGQSLKAVVPSACASYFNLVGTSAISRWSDLEGKTVGITDYADSSYWTTILELKKHHVDRAKIKWIEVKNATNRTQALLAGKIDAGQITPDEVVELMDHGGFRQLASVGHDFPNLLFNAWWTTDDFMNSHGDIVQRFADEMMHQHRLAQNVAHDVKESQTLFPSNKATKSDLEQTFSILLKDKVWDPNETRWNTKAGDYTAKTLRTYNVVNSYVPFKKWGTAKFANAARKKVGSL